MPSPETPPPETIECLGGPLDGDSVYAAASGPIVDGSLWCHGHRYFPGTVELSDGSTESCWIYAGQET